MRPIPARWPVVRVPTRRLTPAQAPRTCRAARAPIYSSSVAAPGSTLSMEFNGTSDDYLNPTALTTLTTNVGIEAWIFPTSNNRIATIAYNGDSGSSGFGLYQFNGSVGNATIIGLIGGVTLGPSVNIPLNQWTKVTQILQGGNDELYVNDVLTASATATPNVPSGIFGIGGHNGEYFLGRIDEVRLFTVPEPTSAVLLILGAVGLCLVGRRRQAA